MTITNGVAYSVPQMMALGFDLTTGAEGVTLATRIAGEDITNDYQIVALSTDHNNGNQGQVFNGSVVNGANATSSGFPCTAFRRASIFAVGNGVNTFQIKLQTSEDSTNYADLTTLSTSSAAAQTQVSEICTSVIRCFVTNGATTQTIKMWLVLHR